MKTSIYFTLATCILTSSLMAKTPEACQGPYESCVAFCDASKNASSPSWKKGCVSSCSDWKYGCEHSETREKEGCYKAVRGVSGVCKKSACKKGWYAGCTNLGCEGCPKP